MMMSDEVTTPIAKETDGIRIMKGQQSASNPKFGLWSGIRKLARERAKKASLHNKKLRDCRVHLGDLKNEKRLETTLFITEGDSPLEVLQSQET